MMKEEGGKEWVRRTEGGRKERGGLFVLSPNSNIYDVAGQVQGLGGTMMNRHITALGGTYGLKEKVPGGVWTDLC